jgi:two-component system, chemotaxis family, chemotaxis protein CheY
VPRRKQKLMPTILIVEDSQVMQAYYKQILATLSGCKVAFVRNGQDALDRIASQGNPDAIVLDINMPVMDGLEFLERYRGDRPRPPAPVVVVSTEGREDDIQRGLDAGASAYLKKPFRPETLHEIILGVFDSQGTRADR